MDARCQQHADAVNITRAIEALSPYLNSPRRTVIRIEAFVSLSVVLMFMQFILGACRRRSGQWFIHGGLWLSYTFSFPLITYTIGQMVSSPIKNGLYPLWAILLLWAVGCTTITAYAIEDNQQWKRYIFEICQYVIYSSLILDLLVPRADRNASFIHNLETESLWPIVITLEFLFALLITTNSVMRALAGWMATNPTPSKVVADYMRDQFDRKETFDPITLKDCRYLVTCPMPDKNIGPNYRTQLTTDSMVTVGTIWELEFGNKNGLVKDVCLSWALYMLLKRRFFGMECAEAGLPATRNFVLKGLLKQEDKENNYTRAFQIIEVELSFLYDFFFTKYRFWSQFEILLIPMAVFKIVLIYVCGAFLLQGFFIIRTSEPVIEVGTTSVDVTITLVIIGFLCLVEALQVILYVLSDWATVSLACSTRRGADWREKITRPVFSCLRRCDLSRTKFGKFLHRLNLFANWQNKMGQSSVIEGCWHVNRLSSQRFPLNYLVDHLNSLRKWKTFVVVPDLVKSEIVNCLQEHSKKGGPLTNGKAALSNGNFAEFDGTLLESNGSQTMNMLIWHIATEYCLIACSNNKVDQSDPHRYVAMTLSRYCAYLMSFVPDLLPGNSADTELVNHRVLLEAKQLLPQSKLITKEILLEAFTKYYSGNSTNDTVDIEQGLASNNKKDNNIFIKGLMMGTKLEKKGVDRWKVMANFWAETIIFIAPSDNVTAHMERLAQGGEFLTHVWALLNHAGILKRDQCLEPEEGAVKNRLSGSQPTCATPKLRRATSF